MSKVGDNDESQVAEETETRWTDDRIRWIEDNHEDDDNNNKNKRKELDDDEEEEDHAYLDPFADANPFDTFSYRTVTVHGYKRDADAVWQSTGVTLWRASEYLCDYLTQKKAKGTLSFDGRPRILELGAGLGLVGLWAHHLMPNGNVCITDGDTDALKLLRQNVQRNQLSHSSSNNGGGGGGGGVVTAHQLIWGKDTTQTFVKMHNDRYDMILASDIVYAAVIVEPLWETVALLLKKTASAVFIMAYAKRDVPVTIQDVLNAADVAGFTHQVTAEDPQGIWVYEFKWKLEKFT
eukprot:scaffold9085_cov215-Amphora_coffeaeformis.AAC.12